MMVAVDGHGGPAAVDDHGRTVEVRHTGTTLSSDPRSIVSLKAEQCGTAVRGTPSIAAAHRHAKRLGLTALPLVEGWESVTGWEDAHPLAETDISAGKMTAYKKA
jgi:hypothetical protein